MAAAWLSSMISSGDLMTRASSMACWASRTAMPCRCSSNRNGGSTMSMPSGSVGHPGLVSSDLISVTASRIRPDLGGDRAAEAEEPGPPVLVRQPLRVQLVMPHRRAEVPQDRVPVPEQQRVADHLVAERAADPGLRGVADVVEVEEQEGAALARLQRRPGPRHAVPAQPGEVDALLVVDPHVAGGTEGPHACWPLRWDHRLLGSGEDLGMRAAAPAACGGCG